MPEEIVKPLHDPPGGGVPGKLPRMIFIRRYGASGPVVEPWIFSVDARPPVALYVTLMQRLATGPGFTPSRSKSAVDRSTLPDSVIDPASNVLLELRSMLVNADWTTAATPASSNPTRATEASSFERMEWGRLTRIATPSGGAEGTAITQPEPSEQRQSFRRPRGWTRAERARVARDRR